MTLRRAAIVAPIRTAVGKFGGSLSPMGAGELGAVILKALIERTGVDPARVDDVVYSQGYGNAEAPAIGHWAWLDRKSVVKGKSVSVRVDLGGGRIIKKKRTIQ